MATQLPFKVECQWLGMAYFEAIAAFNCESAALAYAAACAEVNRDFSYRVKKGSLQLAAHLPHTPLKEKAA